MQFILYVEEISGCRTSIKRTVFGKRDAERELLFVFNNFIRDSFTKTHFSGLYEPYSRAYRSMCDGVLGKSSSGIRKKRLFYASVFVPSGMDRYYTVHRSIGHSAPVTAGLVNGRKQKASEGYYNRAYRCIAFRFRVQHTVSLVN